MYIMQVTPELAPVAKVGGLADVVFGLSRELELRGHAVEIIVPKYDCMWYGQIYGMNRCFDDLWVPWNGGSIHCSVDFGFVHGRKVFFIEPHSTENFFNRGVFYGNHQLLRGTGAFARRGDLRLDARGWSGTPSSSPDYSWVARPRAQRWA